MLITNKILTPERFASLPALSVDSIFPIIEILQKNGPFAFLSAARMLFTNQSAWQRQVV